MTKRGRLNDSSMLQRRIGAKTMKIDVNHGSARRGLAWEVLLAAFFFNRLRITSL